jgi:uncharacterized protein (TIGR00369 family)
MDADEKKLSFEALAHQMTTRALASSEQRFGSFFLSRLLGFEVNCKNNLCVVSFYADPSLGNPQGSLHGGIMATAMDISMGHLLERHVGSGATLDMSTKYLAPVPWGQVRAEGRFLRKAARSLFLESRFFREDEVLAAIATASWKVRGVLRKKG